MQFACVVYAGIFKHRQNIPKYEKLMVVLCVCTRHMTVYGGIRLSGFQMASVDVD